MQARLSNKVPRIFSSACESLEIRWFDREKSQNGMSSVYLTFFHITYYFLSRTEYRHSN